MPGNVGTPNPVGILPKHLSTKFTEKREWAYLSNQFHDSSTQRAQLVLGSRKRFSLAEKLTATEANTLKTFFDAHLGGVIPFWFYNPFEVCPPGTNYDPTLATTTGRYVVRFDNDWNQSTGLMRTTSPDIELVEVSSGAGAGGSLAEQPVPVVGSTLIVRPLIATFYPGTAFCSGYNQHLTPSTDGLTVPPFATMERNCYSGLSDPGFCVFSDFIVPYPSMLTGATVTSSINGGRTFPAGDYAPIYESDWGCPLRGGFFGFAIDGVIAAFGDPGPWPATTSVTQTYDFGFHMVDFNNLNWPAFTAWSTIYGTLNNAGDPNGQCTINLTDLYLTLHY